MRGYLDHLYVHPKYQHCGVASRLCDELEHSCQTNNYQVHASICAKPFFENRGYHVVQKQEVERLGVILTNYKMEKGEYTMLETERLWLRPWREDDAEACYKYAKNPNIGPMAGWLPHESVQQSRDIIKNILSASNNYAVILKETMEPIGSIGLTIGEQSNLKVSEQEGEIGYWIGEPYWGQGLIPEAASKLLEYGFETCHLHTIWCAYYDGNVKSKRVQEKCGFQYVYSIEKEVTALNKKVLLHVQKITKEEWKRLTEKKLLVK